MTETKKRRDGILKAAAWAAALMLPFLFYLYAAAPSLTWLDGGELVAASFSLGTSHPPGHPLYMIAARALAYVLPGNVAFRYNLASALFAVLCLAAAGRLMVELLSFCAARGGRVGERRAPDWATHLCAAAGTLTLGFLPPFAAQALRAEVYTLGFLITTLLLWACTAVMTRPGSERPGLVAPLLFFAGLGLSVHNLTAVLMLPAALLALVLCVVEVRREPGSLLRRLGPGAAALALSLLPMLYAPLRSLGRPYLDYSHVGSPGQLGRVFFGAIYAGSFRETGQGAGAAGHLADFWHAVGADLVPVLFLLAGLGAVVLVRRSRLLSAAFGVAFLFPLAGLISQRVIHPDNPDHGAYVYPSILVLVLLASAALRAAAEQGLVARAARRIGLSAGALCAAAAFVISASQMLVGAPVTGMQGSTTAPAHASLLDRILPANAILFVNNDETGFPLVYAQVVEGRRLDVTPAVPLMLMETGSYASARSFWPDRLPREDAMRPLPSVHAGAPEKVSDSVVNHAGGRYPILWDNTDCRTLKADSMVPYYHLALVVPPLHPELREAWEAKSNEDDLVGLFAEFFMTVNMEGPDVFPLRRLALGSLACTGGLYYRRRNLRGTVLANTLALGFAPGEPEFHYNRAIALENAGYDAKAQADYRAALALGMKSADLDAALARIGEKLAAQGPP